MHAVAEPTLRPAESHAVRRRSFNNLDGSLAAHLLERIHELEFAVEDVAASWHSPRQPIQKRRFHRVPYEKPLVLTPLDHFDQPNDVSKLVWGRNISVDGIAFLHSDPLPVRKAAVTIELTSECPESLIVRLVWCRFTQDGVYQSGGQFLRGACLPDVEHSDWQRLARA